MGLFFKRSSPSFTVYFTSGKNDTCDLWLFGLCREFSAVGVEWFVEYLKYFTIMLMTKNVNVIRIPDK